MGKSDWTVRCWIDEGRIKARHTAHNRYEIMLDDLEALVEQQEGKEEVNPVEQLCTLHQQVEALTSEVETLKGQMAILLGKRGTPPESGSSSALELIGINFYL